MSDIPFTQYLRPDGRKSAVLIDRPDDISAMAQTFIEAGGRYECEHLSTGEAVFTAVMDIDGEPEDVEIEVCPNGPDVLLAVDTLVRKSITHVGRP